MARKSSVRELVFENVIIRSASVHNGDKREARLELTASWTESIRNEMDWKDAPKQYGALDLLGSLTVSQAILTPTAPIAKNGDMGAHKEVFEARELSGFNLVPLKDRTGEVLGRELRFTMVSDKLNMPGLAGRYIGKLGKAPGIMVVVLADESAQGTLDGQE